jgi:AcrR family transcriptional regulator
MGRHPQPERRAALLDACTGYVLGHGLAGLSISDLAGAAGTSPRMLIYHFGTKAGLVTEILREARRRQRALFDGLIRPRPGVPYPEVLRAAWPQLSGPAAMPYHQLFRELHNLPAAASPWPDFPVRATYDWLPAVEAGLRADGRADAGPMATLLLAAVRGLLLDLHVTADRQRADAAFGALIGLLG